jgi:hypothetical protein
MIVEQARMGGIPPRHLAPAVATPVYNAYWHFAAERQRIFFERLGGRAAPWTSDIVLAHHKFTNAYRASDRVSQYLIRRVIYREDLPCSETEVCFRVLLFKLFNKVETWERLEVGLGPLTYADFNLDRYAEELRKALMAGQRIYSGAYIMPPGKSAFGDTAKHLNHLRLLDLMMKDELPKKVAAAQDMRRAFELLRAYPTIGDFLAYQFVTDINYSTVTDFSEDSFVTPGPGAKDGLRKCFSSFGGLTEIETIRLVADSQDSEFERLGISFRSLWGRKLHLIDCQNLFCEISKYSRIAYPSITGISGRTRIKQKYRPGRALPQPWYPPKWGLNEEISKMLEAGSSLTAPSTPNAQSRK